MELVVSVADVEVEDDALELLMPSDANAFAIACMKFDPVFFTLLLPPSSASPSFLLPERMVLDMDCRLAILLLDKLLIVDMTAS